MAICGMIPVLAAWGCLAGLMFKHKDIIEATFFQELPEGYEAFDYNLKTPLTAVMILYSFVTLYPLLLALFWRPVGACAPKLFVCWFRFSNLLTTLANITNVVFACMGIYQIHKKEGMWQLTIAANWEGLPDEYQQAMATV